MSRLKCKGTILQLDISSVYTTIAQLIGLTPPGLKSLSFDATTLDQAGVGKALDLTGYAESDGFEAEIFWDPALSPHGTIETNITTPAKTNWRIELTDSGPTQIDWTSAGLELKPAVAMLDGLKASVKGEVDGLPTVTT
jgi:hypothetical protein